MKRLFTLFIIACILGGNAWGASKLYFEYNIIEISNSDTETHSYYQPLYWLWDDTSTTETPQDLSDHLSDFTITVSTTGDMQLTSYKQRFAVETVNNVTRYEYVLDNLNIQFSGSSGTIKITATNPDFGGVTYTASYTISYHLSSTKWSFYSKKLAIGRYKDNDPKSEFRKWVDNNNWTLENTGSVDPAYWLNLNVNGDISLGSAFGLTSDFDGKLFTEAAGLRFNAPSGTFGMYNESDSVNVAASDRFIALKQGAEVVIPASYFSGLSNPRIRIKMGRYGAPTTGSHTNAACIDLTITNGKDALGNNITGEGTYTIGGSTWWGAKRDPHQRGEYHFQVQEKSQDFKIKVEHGQFLKLYTIEVYNSADMITENAVLGTNYQLLTKKNGNTVDNSRASGTYYLHYRGKGEQTRVYTNNTTAGQMDYIPTGTVVCDNSNFSNYNGGETHTYTATEGQFGTFQMRLACYTHYNNYCTDYADRSQAVGYLETKSYPYTWDFTDVATYEDGPGKMGMSSNENPSAGEGDYATYNRYNKRFHWYKEDVSGGSNYGHRVGVTADGHKITFCGGSQLWYGQNMIPELEGLGFTPSNYSSAYNNTLKIMTGTQGIKIDQGTTTWWCYRVAVPNVPANGAVYVRVHPERSDAYYNVGYSYGDYVKPVNNAGGNVEIAFGTAQATTDGTYSALATDGSGDMIYAVPGNATSASSNITLYFNGVTIKKIAVSTDKKTVNKNGWASESRERVIDPSLTSEMTGQNFSTFLVTGVDNANTHVILTEIGNNQLMPSATEGSFNGCLIHNNANTSVNIVDGGFHLFVPDMHDGTGDTPLKSEISTSNSKLKAKLNSGKVEAFDEDYTNFVFTYKYYDLDSKGFITGTVHEGSQSFYRVARDGANSSGHQAYLPLLTSDVPNSWLDADPSRSYTLVFEDDESVEPTDVESIFLDTSLMKVDNNVYYSLSGQRVNGKPTKGGLYICNGKKIIVK